MLIFVNTLRLMPIEKGFPARDARETPGDG